MTRNETVYTMAQDWLKWLSTRRFFGEPPQQNILAQMMAEKGPSRGEPNGPVSAEMCAFNMSVSSLEIGMFIPFIVVYCEYRPEPIKSMADDLGIGRDQFYERAHMAANAVIKTTRQLVALNSQMQDEVSDFYATK